jgi:hypothetical protein
LHLRPLCRDDELLSLLRGIAPHAYHLPTWPVGGGLYLAYLELMASAPAGSATGRQQHRSGEDAGARVRMLQAVAEGLSAASANLRAVQSQALGGVEEVVVVQQHQGRGDLNGAAPPPVVLKQRVVLSRMAQKVHAQLLSLVAGAPDGAAAPGK